MQQEFKNVYISTYGCQMNVNDSERMYSLLEMNNYQEVEKPEQADLIIINSCSIREKPVHKVHSEAGLYQKLKKKNKALRIGVGGCVGQQEKKNLLKDIPYLDFVFGPDNIDDLPRILEELDEKKKVAGAKFKHQEPYHISNMVRNPGVATFVNITKGCDNFCTFCIVPFTRGRLRSRPLKDLVADINGLVARGVKEVTLLGQNVNSYDSDCGANFAKLLQTLAEDTQIQRIRYTTSHPKDFNQELVDVLAKYRTKLCDYIHLPVQSGSTEVLRRMNRVYTREEYLDKIRMIKEAIPGVSLSTDIICGFPGESDKDFEDTMTLAEEVGYETMYAFMYSPRPFTKAARYEDQVDEKVSRERLNRLLTFHKQQAFDLAKRYQDQVLEVLVESLDKRSSKGADAPRVMGRSTQNKLVHFDGDESLIGQTVKVKITETAPINFNGVRVFDSKELQQEKTS
tara:strand:+ start:2149 stop:3516 length:1368 start_codon:yes stop_codon:yes gene_type:complete